MVLKSAHHIPLPKALWSPSLAALYFVGHTRSPLSGVHHWPHLHVGILSHRSQQGNPTGLRTLCVRQHAHWSVFWLRLGLCRHHTTRPAHAHHLCVENRFIQKNWSGPDLFLCHIVCGPRHILEDMTDNRVQGTRCFCGSSLLQVVGFVRRWHPIDCCNFMLVSSS